MMLFCYSYNSETEKYNVLSLVKPSDSCKQVRGAEGEEGGGGRIGLNWLINRTLL